MALLFPNIATFSVKAVIKWFFSVYLIAEFLVFLYLMSVIQKEVPNDLPILHYLHLNFLNMKNTSIFYKFSSINCQAIKEEKYDEDYAKHLFELKYNSTDEDLETELDDCELYFAKRQRLRGVQNLISLKEQQNPMAFSIGTHSDAVMFERLFSAIYRSHNTYCIHVDLKATFKFYLLVEKLAKCYNSHYGTKNVFLTDDRVSVYWAHWTMVQADLNCMRDLLRRNMSWKWFMNLAGTEYPLMTNGEMLDKILASEYEMVGSIPSEEKFNYRHEFTQYLNLEKEKLYDGPSSTGIRKPPIPYGLKIYKGSKNMAVSRGFVEFVSYSEVSKQLKLWFSDTWAPDEHYIPTLVRVHVDSHVHVIQDHDLNKYIAIEGVIAPELIIRYTIFEEAAPEGWICGGRWQRWLCVFGFINLPELITNEQEHMVANKFDLRMDPVVVQCLEESLIEKGKVIVGKRKR